jgi:hypothetical protein
MTQLTNQHRGVQAMYRSKKDILDTEEMLRRLERLGISRADAEALRRISMTLHRWHELECGTGEGQVTRSVERDGDEPDSKPYMRVQYPTANGYVDRRWAVADREAGARKRLAAIMAKYPTLQAYIQGDPRGCALYILRPGDVPEGEDVSAYYSRGVAVYQ